MFSLFLFTDQKSPHSHQNQFSQLSQLRLQPEAPPEPELPPEPPKPVSNVDFNVKLTYSDGSVKEGHVIRLERSEGFYGMKEWYDKDSRLTLYAEVGSTAKDFAWPEVKSVTIAPNLKDISCVYESDWNPWLYVCTVKTVSSVIDSAGKKWNLDAKHKWRLTFEDESEVEFWLQNYRAMQQDDKEVELGMEAYENPELYSKLQDELRSFVYVKKVELVE